jgi:hypothetical protein
MAGRVCEFFVAFQLLSINSANQRNFLYLAKFRFF